MFPFNSSVRPPRIAIASALLCLLPPWVSASPDQYEASIDGGGGSVSGDGFLLRFSLGQTDTRRLQGDGFTLELGFQRADSAPDQTLFKDGFESDGDSR